MGPDWGELIESFVLDMRRRIDDHAPYEADPGWTEWRHLTHWSLLDRLRKQLGDLRRAMTDNNTDQIVEECADVANFAMMIALQAKGEV